LETLVNNKFHFATKDIDIVDKGIPVCENMQREFGLLQLLSERFEAEWMFLLDIDCLAVDRSVAFLSL
jgi:hypothetical protein